jgi:hypothetical protein
MSLSSFLTSTKDEVLCSSNYRRDIAFMDRFWQWIYFRSDPFNPRSPPRP